MGVRGPLFGLSVQFMPKVPDSARRRSMILPDGALISHRRGRYLSGRTLYVYYALGDYDTQPTGALGRQGLPAVHKAALNEWQLKHRYAMVLHTDDDHPHVHVVVKTVSEQGERLNIRKATLRARWQEFAVNLRELGVAANATERAVRGETRTHRSDGAYRAAIREGASLIQVWKRQIIREWSEGQLNFGSGEERLPSTREEVLEGWYRVSARLKADGDFELGQRVESFAAQMSPAKTEKWALIDQLFAPTRLDERRDNLASERKVWVVSTHHPYRLN